jgi:hypothetical protein
MTPDRERLVALLDALDASETTLQRDLVRSEGRTGDWGIRGKYGHVYPDGAGYLLYVHTDESPRRWFNVKARLTGFCKLTQDGDDEGCLHLERLPNEAEAAAIREAVGIRKRRIVTDAARSHLRAIGKATKSASAVHQSI